MRIFEMIDRLRALTTTSQAAGMAIIFLAFALTGLAFAAPALDGPFYWDDLHLIRVYTPRELSGVWFGPWDPDGLEHPGLRPLSTYFDHLRAAAFGESLVAHRTFLVILFALLLTMASALAREFFKPTFPQLLLGGLFVLFHISSVTHYLWLTDGFFLLSGMLVLAASLCFLRAWRTGRVAWFAAAFPCTVLALLTREDGVVIYPLLIWFGLVLAWVGSDTGPSRAASLKALAWFAAAMMVALGIFWLWRALAVPTSIHPRIDLEALLWALAHTLQNAGSTDRILMSWPRYQAVMTIWLLWLAAVAVIGLRCLIRRDWTAVLCWAGAILITATPVMAVARANLLLLPVVFWGILLAHVLARAYSRTRTAIWRFILCAMALGGLVVPAASSFWLQQEFNPANLDLMCRNALFIYDLYGEPTIPPARRSAVQQQLAQYGIGNVDNFVSRWPAMERKAQSDARFGVNDQGTPFLPSLELLPQFRLHPRCEPPR
jgi:hypothetical protein